MISCRTAASPAAGRNLPCILIAKVEDGGRGNTVNHGRLAAICGKAHLCYPGCIEKAMENLRRAGRHLYFVPAGGHGNPGTRPVAREEALLF